MSDRRIRGFVLGSVVLLLLPVAATALDKEEKAWLEEVKPIMLSSEEKIFNSLKSKEDRAEFQKIFWARRDPDLLTPENETQKLVADRVAIARQKYTKKADKDAGVFLAVSGEQTDCGVTFIALGEPTKQEKVKGEEGAEAKKGEEPMKWTYATPLVNGEFYFDKLCRLPAGSDKTRERLKEKLVLQSDINYHVEKDKLTKSLAEMLPKPGPAQALLLEPRQDFPLGNDTSFVKIAEGGTAVFGLVKGDAKAVTVEDAGGKKKAKMLLRAEAKSENGSTVVAQREVAAEGDGEGSFLASYRLGLRPGKYALKVGAVDPATNKGSVVEQPIEVPDFNKGELTISTLFALEDIVDVQPDPLDAFSGFDIGTTRLVPRFGNSFKTTDSIQISYQFYDPKVDEATKKPSTAARLSILKPMGGVAAEAPEQEFDTMVGGGAVGPVSLAKYAPGRYKIVLKVTDRVAQKDYTQETSFEVKPAAK